MTTTPPEQDVPADDGAPESPDAEMLDEEPRNLIMALVSEIRIGMDLSRITLPTFILEPRSMLEKLTDFMTHGELLALVGSIQDPLDRLIGVVKWYLSGFYIKPQGVKKPYNPLLGEFFRCKWVHGDGSTTHYVAEQVSHHPPISCLYFSNRKEGFVINGSLHPRSKFLGTSVASIMEGTAHLTILPFNEVYTITFPSVYGRGILFGTLLMELVGVVNIQCQSTGCKAEIDFKAKGFFGGEYNAISGKIKRNKDTPYTISGKWDSRIEITNTKTKTSEVFWDPKGATRIPKSTPPIEEQKEFESQKLWTHVSRAIKQKDQREATAEKTKLEEAQRAAVKQRKETGDDWVPNLFVKEGEDWVYKYINTMPYDPREGDQEESDGVIYSVGIGKETTIEQGEARAASAANDEGLSKSGGIGKSGGMTKSGSGFLSLSGGISKSKSNGKGK
jgi:hypothetical protein